MAARRKKQTLAVRRARAKAEVWARESDRVDDVALGKDGSLTLDVGYVPVRVAIEALGERQSVFVFAAATVTDIEPSAELYGCVLRKGHGLKYGLFVMDGETLVFRHRMLADSLTDEEFVTQARMVGWTARKYGPEIRAEFGGVSVADD